MEKKLARKYEEMKKKLRIINVVCFHKNLYLYDYESTEL